MYLMPATPLPVTRAQRRAALGELERRRRFGISGLGCNCRGGHYISGLGDDVAPTDPTLINLENNPAAGMPSVSNSLPPELSPTPVTLPFPDPVFSAPIATPVAPVVVPNVTAAVPPNVAAQLNVVPLTAPTNPMVYQSTLPNPAPKSPVTPWLDQQTIKGVPNKYLIAGAAGILILAAAGKGRR